MTVYSVPMKEKNNTIKVQLAGYTGFDAVLNVASDGVTCIPGLAFCGGSEVPRLEVTDPWSVNVVMKPVPTEIIFADWIDEMGGPEGLYLNLEAFGVLIDGYLSAPSDDKYLGFKPTIPNIGTAIDYYLG